MENQKIIAMIIAALAAILVIIAGKSCSANVSNEKKTPSSGGETASQISISIDQHTAQNNNAANGENAHDVQDAPQEQPTNPEIQYVTDLLGRVIGTEAPENVTKTYIEYHTDLLGRVVGSEAHPATEPTTEAPTHIEYVTDLLGRVIGTEIVTGEKEPATETTTKKNTHQQYPQTTTKGKDKEQGTAPSAIHITIN